MRKEGRFPTGESYFEYVSKNFNVMLIDYSDGLLTILPIQEPSQIEKVLRLMSAVKPADWSFFAKISFDSVVDR